MLNWCPIITRNPEISSFSARLFVYPPEMSDKSSIHIAPISNAKFSEVPRMRSPLQRQVLRNHGGIF